jgi:hypothetical protein
MQKTNPERYLLESNGRQYCNCMFKRDAHTMIKDTTRTLLIARISQCQQKEACLFNDVTVFSLFFFLSYFFYIRHREEDLYIHMNNVTTIAYRLIKNM